jgi:hypothetical protein
MLHFRHRRMLRRPLFRGSGRQVHLLVPSEYVADHAQRCCALDQPDKFRRGGFNRHGTKME